jgi:hypothetical protein
LGFEKSLNGYFAFMENQLIAVEECLKSVNLNFSKIVKSWK